MARERLGKGLDAIFGPSSSRASAHAEGVTKTRGEQREKTGRKRRERRSSLFGSG